MTHALEDVIEERKRQQRQEGFDIRRDDRYVNHELAAAAACYAIGAWSAEDGVTEKMIEIMWPWPWNRNWWKPTTHRRNLVKAGALILAEIERIDRSAK